MSGQPDLGGFAQARGQIVCQRLPPGSVAAPAGSVHPFVATSRSIHVDAHQADIPAAQLGANAVHPPAAFVERDVFLFRNQQGSIVMLSLEFGHHTPGDFTRVRPFKETAVRASLSCSIPAVPIVD